MRILQLRSVGASVQTYALSISSLRAPMHSTVRISGPAVALMTGNVQMEASPQTEKLNAGFFLFASSAPPLPPAAAASSSSRPPRFDRSFVRSALRTFPFSLRVSFAFAVAAVAILIVLLARRTALAFCRSLRYFVFSFRRFSLVDSFVVTSGLFLWIRAFVSLARRDSARLQLRSIQLFLVIPVVRYYYFYFLRSLGRSFVRRSLFFFVHLFFIAFAVSLLSTESRLVGLCTRIFVLYFFLLSFVRAFFCALGLFFSFFLRSDASIEYCFRMRAHPRASAASRRSSETEPYVDGIAHFMIGKHFVHEPY